MGRSAAELEASEATALVVGGGSVEAARRVSRLLRLPFPVLSDRAREAYAACGLPRVFGVLQHGGTILVDRGGVLRYRRGGPNP